MARNPFVPFPTGKGPVKLLLYGEPGTMKTRRALTFPGPKWVVDLEKGADEYGDLAEPGDQYLACQSHTALSDALDYLETLKPGAVGTLIVDPITVVWQSLQAGHAERASTKKKIAPEDVMFDQGVWSRLNRVHNDLVTRLLNAPWHVVMVCRGKELRDAKGEQIIGYSYEGHKSLEFLAKTVVQTRRAGDLVVKDRTGTWAEGHRAPRIDLRELLSTAGSGGARLETASEAARRDAGSSSPPSTEPESGSGGSAAPSSGGGQESRWAPAEQRRFFADLAAAWPEPTDEDPGPRRPEYGDLAAWCESHGHPRPSAMTPARRAKLLEAIRQPGKRDEIAEWIARQDVQQAGAA